MNLTEMKSWFELAYYASGVALVIVAVIGLRQITVLKADSRVRNQRAAKERAIEYSSRYLTRYVPLSDKFGAFCREKSIAGYNGPIGDFSLGSLPAKYIRAHGGTTTGLQSVELWLNATNELAVIAAAFTSGVADEEEGFTIIGRTFCNSVESEYDRFAVVYTDPVYPYYQPIITLYRLWKPRLKAAELLDEREKIESELNRQQQVKIKPIGCE